MGHAKSRSAVNAMLSVAMLGLGLAACSAHHATVPKVPAAAVTGSQNDTAAAQPGGGATNAANGGGDSAGSASPSVLGGGKGCSLLSASDVTSAAGLPLPSMVGNVNGGLAGNSGHDGCLYTKDDTGIGADVSVEVNTFATGVADQLATLRKSLQDQVDSANDAAANSATLKDAAVGDAGFEVDYTTGPDETVWFTKGSKLVEVEVNKGKPGAVLNLAKIVAGKE